MKLARFTMVAFLEVLRHGNIKGNSITAALSNNFLGKIGIPHGSGK